MKDFRYWGVFLERPRGNPERPAEVLQVLLEAGADVNAEDIDLVAKAYGYHSPGYARILLGHGAKVDGSRSYAVLRSLLHMKASEEDVVLVLSMGADPNAPAPHYLKAGGTILHEVAQTKETHVLEKLVSGGGDINCKNGDGDTPLHVSCLAEVPAMTGKLIELGCNLNAQNSLGYTALHYCCLREKSVLAALLIRAGADPSIATQSGLRCSQIAAAKDDQRILTLLFEAGEKATDNLLDRANLRATKTLIKKYL